MGFHDVAIRSESDDWPTDPALFARLNKEFGPFELDVCASHANHKCDRYYTVDDDGLAQPWKGKVWMNPPYGRTIGQWMRKAALAGGEGATVVCLVPARVDSRWWREACEKASLVRIFPGRLRFGPLLQPAPFPSALIVFGPLERRHGMEAMRCEVCNEWFWPARKPAQYCSVRCQVYALRRRSAYKKGA